MGKSDPGSPDLDAMPCRRLTFHQQGASSCWPYRQHGPCPRHSRKGWHDPWTHRSYLEGLRIVLPSAPDKDSLQERPTEVEVRGGIHGVLGIRPQGQTRDLGLMLGVGEGEAALKSLGSSPPPPFNR